MDNNTLVIFIICACLIALIGLVGIYLMFPKENAKWKRMLDPSDPNIIIVNKKQGAQESNDIKNKRKPKSNKTRSERYIKLDKKITYFYWQGGIYDKNLQSFIGEQIKYTFIGIAFGIYLFLLLKNIPLAVIPGVILFLVPLIRIYDNVSKRRSEFRESFPFFLKTLSFVLQNGANTVVAIKDVTSKLNDSVLKEVMEDVISVQTINGGNFVEAFKTISKKVDCDEVNEFIEIIVTNSEKGVGVADTFLSQSESLSRITANKKMKKLASIENKILIPLLLVIVGVGMLVLSI